MANDHAKGDGEAFPSSCHAALMLINDFKPLIIEGPALVAAQGTAFAQKQKGAGTPATGTECTFNKEQADRGCAAGAFFCGGGGKGAFGQKRL